MRISKLITVLTTIVLAGQSTGAAQAAARYNRPRTKALRNSIGVGTRKLQREQMEIFE
jgi:hypothetical protein